MSRMPEYRSNRPEGGAPPWPENGANGAPHKPEPGGGSGLRLSQDYVTGGLLAGIALLLLAEVPQLPGMLRTLLFQGAATGILFLLAFSRGFADDMRVALRRGPHPFLLALLVWCAVSAFAIAPYRGFAAAELLRVVVGAGVYFLAAYSLPERRAGEALGQVVAVMLGLGVVIALYDFAQFGQMVGGAGRSVVINRYSVFGTHESVGSLLVLLLPVALAFAISPRIGDRVRLTAQAVSLVLGCALLLARTRSAWVAGVVALITLSILFARYMAGDANAENDEEPGRPRRRRGQPRSGGRGAFLGSPIVLVTLAFAVMIGLGGIAPILSDRAGTMLNVLEDDSFSERLVKWGGAARMAAEKPVTGWGLGAWTVMQGRWTHLGHDVSEVLTRGTGHENVAHNFYVQWAAEAGSIGLALFVAVLLAFLIAAVRALPTVTSPLHRTLLIGCIASVVGAMVDALASPGYNFPGVWAVLWLWMGLGVAAMRGDREARRNVPPGSPPPSLAPTPPLAVIGALAGGVAAALVVLGIGASQLRAAKTAPVGALTISVRPEGVIRPGTQVLWTVSFKDGAGKIHPTMPGTRWTFVADQYTSSRTQAAVLRVNRENAPDQSGFQAIMPSTLTAPVTLVTVGAVYWDSYGRGYNAVSTVVVQRGALPAR